MNTRNLFTTLYLKKKKKKYKEIVKLKVSYVNRLSTIAATGGKIKAYLQNTT